jgi:hypothetical protein
MLLMGSKDATLTLQLLMTTVTSSNVMELSAGKSVCTHIGNLIVISRNYGDSPG